MDINNDLIEHLEGLAKIRLSGSEKKKIIPQIEEVIQYFNTSNELDTEGVEPLSHAIDVNNALRVDEVKPSLSADNITVNGKTENGFFVVPQTVEG